MKIYEEGEFANNKKMSVTQYYYNRKDRLEIKTIDFKKFEETLVFKDGTKIVKEMFRYRIEMISFNLPISSSDRGILKAYKYKDDKLKSEAFFSAGILKKIIHYNDEENIESIDYFDIYYDNDIKEFNSFYNFRDKKDLFEDSLLNRKDLKIYKRDFYKIEKVINYWGTTFESVLERIEYYFENSENIKTEEVNKRVYLDYDFESKFIKILFKE